MESPFFLHLGQGPATGSSLTWPSLSMRGSCLRVTNAPLVRCGQSRIALHRRVWQRRIRAIFPGRHNALARNLRECHSSDVYEKARRDFVESASVHPCRSLNVQRDAPDVVCEPNTAYHVLYSCCTSRHPHAYIYPSCIYLLESSDPSFIYPTSSNLPCSLQSSDIRFSSIWYYRSGLIDQVRREALLARMVEMSPPSRTFVGQFVQKKSKQGHP